MLKPDEMRDKPGLDKREAPAESSDSGAAVRLALLDASSSGLPKDARAAASMLMPEEVESVEPLVGNEVALLRRRLHASGLI